MGIVNKSIWLKNYSNPKMKILVTATVLSHICQFHLPHMKALQEQGHTIHVAAHDNLAVKNGLQLKYCDKFIDMPEAITKEVEVEDGYFQNWRIFLERAYFKYRTSFYRTKVLRK